MTPAEALARIDVARRHVERARLEWDRTNRVDGVGTRMSGVARDRLAYAERELRAVEATIALARLAEARP